jgi:uncharacterized protein YfaT (DUF1175 family)
MSGNRTLSGSLWKYSLCCIVLAAATAAQAAMALTPGAAVPTQPQTMLDAEQARDFRAWMLRIVQEQVRQGPTPRWVQRDCAGLVRFAVAESLRLHDARWLRANGLTVDQIPADLHLSAVQQKLRHAWRQPDKASGAYASAIVLVQENSQFVSRDINQAQPGDLLFYDQGDDQHLMIWMGGMVAYHTGTVTPQDNGLRSVHIAQLLQWKDTRWRPTQENPNFAGIYRLAFLPR